MFSWVKDPFANTGEVIYLEQIGALNQPNAITAVFFGIAVPFQIYASYRFIRHIIRNNPEEKALIVGIVLTFLLVVNEFNIILKG